jgi:hypothetical protein
MIENKIFVNGKLNRDDDYHLLPKNDWVDARNVRVNSTSVGYSGSFTNIKGMDFFPYPTLDGEIVIGARGFDSANKIFYFIYNGIDATKNKVVSFDATTETYTTIIESAALNFSGLRAYRINHIDLLDNRFLYWVDNLNAPRMIDLEKVYDVIDEQAISVIKYAPISPPSNLEVIDDCTINSNKIKDKNYQFKYRWIYWDNSHSAFSPISNMSNQQGRASGVLSYGLLDWYESALKFNFEGGGSLVKGYEIIAREGNTGDWAVIASTEYSLANSRKGYGVKFIYTSGTNTYDITVTYNGTTYSFGSVYATSSLDNLYQVVYDNFTALGLTDLTIEMSDSNTRIGQEQYLYITSVSKDVEFSIDTASPRLTTITQNSFLSGNDITNTFVFSSFQAVSAIDQAEANIPYSYIPLVAGAQCMPNGGYLAYGNYIEGYDNVDINSTAGLSKRTIAYPPQFSVVASDLGSGTTHFEFDGYYGGGEMAFVVTRFTPDSSQYTFSVKSNIQNETQEEFIARIAFIFSTYHEGVNVINIDSTGFDITGGVGVNQKRFLTTILSTDTKQSLKSGDEYQYGIVYIDAAGRYGSVNTSQSMIVKTDPLDIYSGSGNKWLTGMVTVNSRPPSWAKKYTIVRTKRKKKDFFLQMFVDNITFSTETALIDLQASISKYNDRYGTNISYSWVAGDRIQLVYTNASSGDDSVYDAAIKEIDTDGNLVVSSSGMPGISAGVDNGFIEIYRESSSANAQLFWETAEFGDIGNPGEATAYHIRIYDDNGSQSQDANNPSDIPLIHYSNTGDVWFKQRFLPVPVLLESTLGFYTRAWCESPSFSDFNADTFTTDSGRANVQNAFEKQTRYPATVRYSGAYVPGTQINNISSFNEESFQDYSSMYGPIQKLDIDGSEMIVAQQLRIGWVFVFKELVLDQNNNTLISNSDKLLNGIKYYKYEVGMGDAPESYVRWGSSKYGVDNLRGIVWRLAENGVTPISITAKMNSYFRSILPTVKALAGGFDPTNNEYYISMIGEPGESIVWDEQNNGFSDFRDIGTPYFATLGKHLYAFEGAALYRLNSTENYNDFFGATYPSSVTFVANENPLIRKSYLGLSESSSDVWSAPEITTSILQESNLEDADFATREGEHYASFLRDSRDTPGVENPLLNGDQLKGKWIKVKLEKLSTDFVYLLSVGVKYVTSPQTGV